MVLCKEDQERLLGIRTYIGEHLADDLSQERLSSLFYLSVSTLRRHFCCVYGMTIHDHILAVRMSRARELLESGALSLSPLAQEVGYRDTLAFCRAYERFYGVNLRDMYPNLL